MSTQIDIVPERRKPGQGSWVGGSTATFDDRYRFSARSANLICRIARDVADKFKMEVKNFWQAYSFWRATVLAIHRTKTRCLRFSARIFLEITRIDILYKIIVYKKVITFSKTECIL